VIALPVLLLGLSLSEIAPLPAGGGYVMEGNSILYLLLKRLMLGAWLPRGGRDVMLHSVAMAGWAGLLVTAFNLIPAGQLDGGHIAYALLGYRARHVTWVVIGLLLLMGMVWEGWLLWAGLVFLFSRSQSAPLDDVSPISRHEELLAAAMLVLFVLLFTPVPLQVV